MDEELKELRDKIEKYENFFSAALEQKYDILWPPEIKQIMFSKLVLVRQWQQLLFFDTYIQSNIYPQDRLPRVMYNLLDVKLQIYDIMEVHIGLYNYSVYGVGYDPLNPQNTPRLTLIKLSLDQSLIAKSRILWERIMNFVFYLERGEDLEGKQSNKRSKKKVFFDEMKKDKKWDFLTKYGDVLTYYDDKFRTPEFHKGSLLRGNILGIKPIDDNDLLDPINEAINSLWENTLAIISGNEPVFLHKGYLELNKVNQPED